RKPVLPKKLAELLVDLPALAKIGDTSKGKTYTRDELQAAIVAGDLVTYYQPIVAVKTGQLVGMEALVRWQHPNDGLVPPDAFISLAEQSELIDELTDKVVDSALTQARLWRDQGLKLSLCINLSMDRLIHSEDRKSTRLNSSHVKNSYAVF